MYVSGRIATPAAAAAVPRWSVTYSGVINCLMEYRDVALGGDRTLWGGRPYHSLLIAHYQFESRPWRLWK